MSVVRKIGLNNQANPYRGFDMINGEHPLKERAPGSYVEYAARYRKGAKVAYFNFDLAREMGLIAHDHPNRLTRDLEAALIRTFGITIVNEWDVIHDKVPTSNELSPHRYMATRYLQLQHESRVGMTSGDGRSIWNGYFKGPSNKTWDISSCGTGATCLSPAHAKHKKFFRTGDPAVSYGCGMADLTDGITNAMFSELLYLDGIPTERTLVVLEFPKSSAVVVRASPNLIRPSHMFVHLKQRNYQRLKGVVDLFIERQIANKEWHDAPKMPKERYGWMAKTFARVFGEMVARFEREYIFCWLDWDGDNIMADGRVIDYGSIRRFGVNHHQYRFDDVERWSTNINEQRMKARATVQTMIQVSDYLATGKCKKLSAFSKHRYLREFDAACDRYRDQLLLQKLGLTEEQAKQILRDHLRLFKQFSTQHDFFEGLLTKKSFVKVQDGKNRPAILNMNHMRSYLLNWVKDETHLRPEQMLKSSLTRFAQRSDRLRIKKLSDRAAAMADAFKKLFDATEFSERPQSAASKLNVLKRALQMNRTDRITGDGMIFIGRLFSKRQKTMAVEAFYSLIQAFVARSTVNISFAASAQSAQKKIVSIEHARVFKAVDELVSDYQESL